MLFNHPRITRRAEELVALAESGQKLDSEQIEFLEAYAVDQAMDFIMGGSDQKELVKQVDMARRS